MSTTRNRFHSGLTLAAAAGLAIVLVGTGGCETESWLGDPSVSGRWNHTPARVPVLRRLASVEGPGDEFVEVTDVRPDDLVPEVTEYRIGPGDRVIIVVYDIPDEGRASEYTILVDPRGMVNIPQLGELNVSGRTTKEAEQVVMNAMKDLVANPLAALRVDAQRQQRFSVFGGVAQPGQYQIPVADYKILEGLTAAGGFSEAAEYIYVIRQVPLTQAAAAGRPTPGAMPENAKPAPTPSQSIDQIINDLSKPKGSPAVMSKKQPDGQPATIDLIDPAAQPAAPAEPMSAAQTTDGSWVFVNGQWVKVAGTTSAPSQGGAVAELSARTGSFESLVTQRVIRIPRKNLVAGDGRFNIILRPGDIVRVPPPPQGTIFVGGQVNRPGTYNITDNLTLSRIIIAAGGLNATAVPDRVDIVRMVGPEEQAMVRVSLKAINRGEQPDIFLNNNDIVNIGTNFWATPLAIIRNGFRMTYGFGFLVDRNFGNDVFGAPPDNRF
jgi:polysaccharide biosynthesis/export protein